MEAREVNEDDGIAYEIQLASWWWQYIGIPILKLNPLETKPTDGKGIG